jgi:cell division topological specificity factor
MSLFGFFNRKPTAAIARDRLQILLAHERASLGGNSDLIAILQEEILQVIAKHVFVERDKVQVKLDRGNAFSTLEIGVEIPPGLAEKQPKAVIRAT